METEVQDDDTESEEEPMNEEPYEEYEDEAHDIGLLESDPVSTDDRYPFPIVPKETVTLSVSDKIVVYYLGSRPGWYEGIIDMIDTTFHIPKYTVLYKDGLADVSLHKRAYGSTWVKPLPIAIVP
jgi:hypothetical protein